MWKVEVKKITSIQPIENASAIETAMLGGWPCVVPKGQFKEGELVVYYPEDSIMPDETLKRMGLTGKLAGTQRNRIKAIRLRGQLSIGLVEKIDILPRPAIEDEDVTELLGITRYEAPIPACLRGKVGNHPMYWHKYDIENVFGLMRLFNKWDYVWVVAKVHGTSSSFSYNPVEGFKVSSRNLTLEREEGNVYWNIAIKFDIENKIKSLFESLALTNNDCLTIHGEIFGSGVQDLTYGQAEPTFAVFDIRKNSKFFNFEDLNTTCEKLQLPTLPILYCGFFDLDKIKTAISGNEPISGKELHINEGGVIRNYDREKIAKIISESCALRKGGTEYH